MKKETKNYLKLQANITNELKENRFYAFKWRVMIGERVWSKPNNVIKCKWKWMNCEVGEFGTFTFIDTHSACKSVEAIGRYRFSLFSRQIPSDYFFRNI